MYSFGHVDARDRDVAVVVHLLDELACELDRLDVRAERAAEDALEERLELRFDGAEHGHGGRGCCPGARKSTACAFDGQGSAAVSQARDHEREHGGGGREQRGGGQERGAEAGGRPRAAPADVRQQPPRPRARTSASASSAGWPTSCGQSACATALGRSEPVIPSPSGGVDAVEGQRRPPEPGDDGREQDRRGGLAPRAARGRAPAARRAAASASAASGASSGPAREQQPGARVAPVQRRPAGGERRVDDREPERDVREREERDGQREQRARRAARRSRARRRAAASPSGQLRG